LPVGTILAYNGNLADIPSGWHLCDGTDGTPNLLDNRFLEGDGTPGLFKEPGLPNITGIFTLRSGSGGSSLSSSGDAFFSGSVLSYGSTWQESSNHYNAQTIGFDASRSNLLFGAANTVQPKAYTVLYIIKVK